MNMRAANRLWVFSALVVSLSDIYIFVYLLQSCGSETRTRTRISCQNATPADGQDEGGHVSSPSQTVSEPATQLVAYCVSPAKGYVESPRILVDNTTTYPAGMSHTVRIAVPAGHVVMSSFQVLDLERDYYDGDPCYGEYVSLGVRYSSAAHSVGKFCHIIPEPFQFSRVEFLSVAILTHKRKRKKTGFRILFTFHKESVGLQKLPDGKWNCTVPHWADFQHHFHCNLVSECAGGEDERDCPYADHDICAPGLVSADGSCFLYVTPKASVTSGNEAYKECALREARLASVNTKKKWEMFLSLVQIRQRFSPDQILRVYIGLRPSSPHLPYMYRYLPQWEDGSMFYYSPLHGLNWRGGYHCFALMTYNVYGYFDHRHGPYFLFGVDCHEERHGANILCEVDNLIKGAQIQQENEGIQLRNSTSVSAAAASLVEGDHVVCPAGYITHAFLACDVMSACWARQTGTGLCDATLTPLPPSFMCTDGIDHVPYTLVCDHREDCSDASDEDFCNFPTDCDQFDCGNQQCVSLDRRCDGKIDSVNEADEQHCARKEFMPEQPTIPSPAIISYGGLHNISLSPFSYTQPGCPATHFQCPGDGYCLPLFFRCNGAADCPGHEDEAACDRYMCPRGLYRCRDSRICLYPDHLCDGIDQCPQRDDELCEFTCATNCTCYGLSFFCNDTLQAGDFPELRYLDASSTSMRLSGLASNTKLVFLNLAKCGLTQLDIVRLPNLYILDISHNLVRSVAEQHFQGLQNLRHLSLAENPIVSFSSASTGSRISLPSLHTLDLSGIIISELNADTLEGFQSLQSLNLSQSKIVRVSHPGFQLLRHLRKLDLRGCPMTDFQKDLFLGLRELETVSADNFKVCCPVTLPEGFNVQHCHAPYDEVSSCEALLRSNVYRVFLVVFAVCALLGNVSSFLYRAFFDKALHRLGFGVFVIHLTVADFLMGVYLAVVGVADRLYRGTYLWRELVWRNSPTCKAIGFLSLLSSEVSAFLICLITLDRFLVFRFPFRQLRFTERSAHVACVSVWMVGLVLAAVPMLPMTSHWEFYSQTGICTPLPFTTTNFPGHRYSFGVMIVLNFVVFLSIATGQAFIVWSVRQNTISASDTSRQSQDTTIARRLLTVVVSDFLCWFPIGLLGIMASTGTPIPDEVNVAMAIIALPVNSALNPFLYTLNILLEKRRRKIEACHKKALAKTLTAEAGSVEATEAADVGKLCLDRESASYTSQEVADFVQVWLDQGTLSYESVARRVRESTTRE